MEYKRLSVVDDFIKPSLENMQINKLRYIIYSLNVLKKMM